MILDFPAGGVVSDGRRDLTTDERAAAVLVPPFPTLEEAAACVATISRAGIVPAALEIVDRPCVDVSFRKKGLPVPFPEAEARLLVEFDGGGEEEVERDVARCGEVPLEAGALDVVLATDEARRREPWEVRRGIGEAVRELGSSSELDLAVPRTELAAGARRAARSARLDSPRMSAPAFEPVIGLEVHAQLKTRTKSFCSCPVVFGAEPNSAVCPVCLGYPGALPVLNREMVTLAIRLALATGCEVHRASVFARKNYFYPDLPKGYQISQYDRPLATGGRIEVRGEGGAARAIRLHRIHLEEDAGKSMHETPWDDVPSDVSLVDLNRAGTPLAEIVTEPDLRSPDEAYDFLARLRRLVRWVGASDGNMEEGSLRCDANVSLRPAGASALGTKVEIKNLNSIAHVKKALEHEIARQAETLRRGGEVVQETRLFDPGSGATRPMRSKEEAMDYRYFPDPDLGTLVVDEAWREEVAAALPELPEPRAARLSAELNLPATDAATLCSARPFADAFEEAVAAHPANPKGIANWFLGDLLARMTDADRQEGRLPVPPAAIARLVARIDDGTISGKIAKELFPLLCEGAADVDALIREKGLVQVTDEAPIRAAVDAVVAANPAQVAAYRGGKAATFGWFVGQVMKATGGKASPALVNRLLREALGA